MLRCLALVAGFFFFNDTATTEIYTLSLHDALPISGARSPRSRGRGSMPRHACTCPSADGQVRSEEHTSELQSQSNLVCRLLLEKKNTDRHLRSTSLSPVRVSEPDRIAPSHGDPV